MMYAQIAASIVFFVIGAMLLRAGMRWWGGGGARPSARMNPSLFSDEFLSGFDRGVLALGWFMEFAGLMVLMVGIIRFGGGKGSPLARSVGIVSVFGVLVSIWTFLLIVWFNRPKFLVPPHLRHESGTFATRWRQGSK
jgi:hypothetical protein